MSSELKTVSELVEWLGQERNQPYENEDDNGDLRWYSDDRIAAFVSKTLELVELLKKGAKP